MKRCALRALSATILCSGTPRVTSFPIRSHTERRSNASGGFAKGTRPAISARAIPSQRAICKSPARRPNQHPFDFFRPPPPPSRPSSMSFGPRRSILLSSLAFFFYFAPMAIRILVTGGTFDKEYNERTGQLYFKDTHLAEMLLRGRSRVEVTIRTIMMIDSLEMTDAARALIVQNCQQAPENRIVITHGTDTMTETAAAIAASIADKTIVL